ncbi:MAG: hypothetical protein GX815_09185 [Clostridiales bacterium]|nr:hypothetical protein [Clostridiales bacterium]
MALTITGNSILDLASIQALSILYLSEAALPLVKWKKLDDPLIAGLEAPPPAAWYGKAAGTKLKISADTAKPSMIATGFSIQTLSRLADNLPKYSMNSYLSKSALHQKWQIIAALQLEFCLEYLEESSFSAIDSAAVLEGGVWFLKTRSSIEEARDFQANLDVIYQNITESLDPYNASTLELASTIRGITVWYKYNNSGDLDDTLSTLVLEVLNRKSQSGLFHYGPYGRSSVPMGQQFFILDSLLQAYSYVKLDYVLEEVFDIFSNLYNIAYKDTLQIFTFKQKNISYTAYEIATLLSCLNKIAIFSYDNSDQRTMINQIIDTFLEFISQSYMEFHEDGVRKLLKWICLSNECKVGIENKPPIRTLFPKRIRLCYPGPKISWDRKAITNQADIFFLCSTLLDFLDEDSTETQKLSDSNIELPVLNTLSMLFDLLNLSKR